jgi:hypothetical protein
MIPTVLPIGGVPLLGQEFDLAIVTVGEHVWVSAPTEVAGVAQGSRFVVTAATSAFVDPTDEFGTPWPTYVSRTEYVPFTVCHAPNPAAMPLPINGADKHTFFAIMDNVNSAVSVNGTMEAPAAGTYYVGLCALQLGGINNTFEFDFASGWVMVIPPQP